MSEFILWGATIEDNAGLCPEGQVPDQVKELIVDAMASLEKFDLVVGWVAIYSVGLTKVVLQAFSPALGGGRGVIVGDQVLLFRCYECGRVSKHDQNRHAADCPLGLVETIMLA